MNSEIFWKFKEASKKETPKKEDQEPINLEE